MTFRPKKETVQKKISASRHQLIREYTDQIIHKFAFTAVPDNNDIEAIFTWRGHGCSFVGFLSGNERQLHLDSDFLLQFLLRLFHKLAH